MVGEKAASTDTTLTCFRCYADCVEGLRKREPLSCNRSLPGVY